MGFCQTYMWPQLLTCSNPLSTCDVAGAAHIPERTTEILELKNVRTEIRNSVDGFRRSDKLTGRQMSRKYLVKHKWGKKVEKQEKSIKPETENV